MDSRSSGASGRCALFVEDLQDLSEQAVQDAMFGGDHVEFKRADLAKAFDIHSAVFVPTATGVLEVGSTDKVVSASGFVPSYVLLCLIVLECA